MRSLILAALVASATLPAGTARAASSTDATDTGGTAKGQSLSSKLSESGGVIKPKTNVDPGIHVDAPDPHPNSTPVVPPAATGGGTAK